MHCLTVGDSHFNLLVPLTFMELFSAGSAIFTGRTKLLTSFVML